MYRRAGVYSACNHTDLQRNQSGDSLIYVFAALSAEGHVDRGAGDHSSIRADGPDEWGGGGSSGDAVEDFIAQTVEILSVQPTPAEICVERVHNLRFAEANGSFDAVFKG